MRRGAIAPALLVLATLGSRHLLRRKVVLSIIVLDRFPKAPPRGAAPTALGSRRHIHYPRSYHFWRLDAPPYWAHLLHGQGSLALLEGLLPTTTHQSSLQGIPWAPLAGLGSPGLYAAPCLGQSLPGGAGVAAVK